VHSRCIKTVSALFSCHSGESRNPSSSCDLGIPYEIPAFQSVQKPSPPLFSAIPASFCHSGESRNPAQYSARYAHIADTGGPPPPFKGARSARIIRWIPAPVQARGRLCAGMAVVCHAIGKFFRAALDFQGFCTVCFVGMARRRCVLGYVLIRVLYGATTYEILIRNSFWIQSAISVWRSCNPAQYR